MSDPDALERLAARAIVRGAPRLDDAARDALVAALPGWSVERGALVRNFAFADYPSTILFVNALAFEAQRMDHHPELEVGYGRCRVAWTTHDAGGLTVNDCIAAARTQRLRA